MARKKFITHIEATTSIDILGNAGTATKLKNYVQINGLSFNGSVGLIADPLIEQDLSTNATRYLSFVDSTTATYQRLNVDDTLNYNPSTGTLSATIFKGTLDGTAILASKLSSPRTISLNGDVTGSVNFDGSSNITITATVMDDSHNHIIGNIDGLQVALDSKIDSNSNLLVNPNTTASNPDTLNMTGIDYCNSISLFGQTDGALYTNSHSTSWQHQIYGDYRSGNIAVRGKNNGNWTSWTKILNDVNSNVINWVTPGKVKAHNLGRTLRRDTIDGDTNQWDSQAYSVESYAGDVKLSFRISEIDADDNHTMIGLNTDPTTDASYSSIDYCWFVSNGSMSIYESGSSKGVYGTWNTNSVYSVQRIDSTIVYKQDDNVVRTVNGATASPLFVDSSFHSNIEIRDIAFGPADVSLRLKIDNSNNAFGSGLQMLQSANDTTLFPNTDWWSSLRLLHNNSAGYYTELATCFHSDTIAFRRNVAGSKSAWKYIPFTDGTGASGTWGISITGNAATATTLQTARTINGVSFNGSADITVYDSTKAPLASPALTGTPTAPTAPTGTNTTQLATTAFVQATKIEIGVGQTWQNVTASRSQGVTYTNSTGRSIMVSVAFGSNNTTETYIIVDGNVGPGDVGYTSGGYVTSVTAIIPNGSTYSVNYLQSAYKWLELR